MPSTPHHNRRGRRSSTVHPISLPTRATGSSQLPSKLKFKPATPDGSHKDGNAASVGSRAAPTGIPDPAVPILLPSPTVFRVHSTTRTNLRYRAFRKGVKRVLRTIPVFRSRKPRSRRASRHLENLHRHGPVAHKANPKPMPSLRRLLRKRRTAAPARGQQLAQVHRGSGDASISTVKGAKPEREVADKVVSRDRESRTPRQTIDAEKAEEATTLPVNVQVQPLLVKSQPLHPTPVPKRRGSFLRPPEPSHAPEERPKRTKQSADDFKEIHDTAEKEQVQPMPKADAAEEVRVRRQQYRRRPTRRDASQRPALTTLAE